MQEKIKKNLITIEELSKISGEKIKNLSSYIRKGILFYEEQADNGIRYYDKDKALGNLKEIKKLEKEGYSIKEIKERLTLKHLFEKVEELQE